MAKLFVYGVNARCPRDTLEAEFARCGDVTDVYITEKGYAFVTMADDAAAAAAIKELNGIVIDGQEIKVDNAHGGDRVEVMAVVDIADVALAVEAVDSAEAVAVDSAVTVNSVVAAEDSAVAVEAAVETVAATTATKKAILPANALRVATTSVVATAIKKVDPQMKIRMRWCPKEFRCLYSR
jgi:hypothetical protein